MQVCNVLNLNCFEKTEVRWQKYFKIMVKLEQNTIRSTELSIAYSPCYMQFWTFALLRLCLISGVGKGKMRGIVRKIAYNGKVYEK